MKKVPKRNNRKYFVYIMLNGLVHKEDGRTGSKVAEKLR
jgi:hypothetical protein